MYSNIQKPIDYKRLCNCYLPKDLVNLVLLFCGENEIIKLQNTSPESLKHICVDDLNLINKKNHKYIKNLKATSNLTNADLKSLLHLQTLYCGSNNIFTDDGQKGLPNIA